MQIKNKTNTKRKAIIVGASSGIGKALTFLLYQEGYEVAITARREELLQAISSQLNGTVSYKQMDLKNIPESVETLNSLIQTMEDVDLVIICAGVGFINSGLELEKELETIHINVSGFTAIADTAYKYFSKRGKGHIVGISSLASIRGAGDSPSYGASKAYVANYLEALRNKSAKQNPKIIVTDIQPGFIDTDMAKGDGIFWLCNLQKAAKQIFKAIKAKKAHAYVSKRWWIVAIILKLLPNWIYDKL